jgi:hypothetical protein
MIEASGMGKVVVPRMLTEMAPFGGLPVATLVFESRSVTLYSWLSAGFEMVGMGCADPPTDAVPAHAVAALRHASKPSMAPRRTKECVETRSN